MYYPGVWVKLEIVVQNKLCFGRLSTILSRHSDRSFFLHYLSTAYEAIIEVIDLEATDDDNEYPKMKKPLCTDIHLIIMGEKLTDIEINHSTKKVEATV